MTVDVDRDTTERGANGPVSSRTARRTATAGECGNCDTVDSTVDA
ncbi:hypothetical protein ACFQL0_09170 [Haloplanus litoreus]